jgi:hypothetical protein
MREFKSILEISSDDLPEQLVLLADTASDALSWSDAPVFLRQSIRP